MSTPYAMAEDSHYGTHRVRRGAVYEKQPAHEDLLHDTEDAERACKAMKGTWTGNLKKFNGLASPISRARSTGGPVLVLFRWLRALHRAGFPKWLALRLVVALRAFIDRVWADEVCTKDETLFAAHVAETEAQHAVDLVQLALADRFCPERAEQLVELAHDHIARAMDMMQKYAARVDREKAGAQ